MGMRLSRALLGIALALLIPSVAYSQTPKTPDFSVQVWGDIATEFSTRVSSYVDLRRKLEVGLPALTLTDDAATISRAQRALANEIRAARSEAREGDLFTPTISDQFKKVLLLQMNLGTWASIMSDNPGEFRVRINATYPYERPLSTVPPNILAALPSLPDDVEYRFVGRHLILLDTKARVILDRIPYAIAIVP